MDEHLRALKVIGRPGIGEVKRNRQGTREDLKPIRGGVCEHDLREGVLAGLVEDRPVVEQPHVMRPGAKEGG